MSISDDNGHRLLTVKQFAEEKGVPIATIYTWMRKGYFEINKIPGIPFLIPEHYLVDGPPSREEKVKLPRKSYYVKVPKPTTLEESKEKFHRLSKRKISLSFDELRELFEKDIGFREIGEMGGVSWQAISQIYARYFAPFLGESGYHRRSKLAKERRLKKIENYVLDHPILSHLLNIITDLGMDMEPILIDNRYPDRCHATRVKINDKLCGLHHVTGVTNIHYYRYYYRCNLSHIPLSKQEFVIFLTGEDLRDIFVVPSRVLLDTYNSTSGKNWKTFYIPTEKLPTYNNQSSYIDWWKYESAWDQLKGEL